jgi:hypothetical protein
MRTDAIWFARFSSLDSNSPGGFCDLGIGATVGGFAECVLSRFLDVISRMRRLGWVVGVLKSYHLSDRITCTVFLLLNVVTPRVQELHVEAVLAFRSLSLTPRSALSKVGTSGDGEKRQLNFFHMQASLGSGLSERLN